MTKKVRSNNIPLHQIGLPIWELDYSKIEDDLIRSKYIEFADYSKGLLLKKFYKAFRIGLDDRFEFDLHVPEGSDCWMTKLAEEEYHYIDRITRKSLHIYINFRCNRKCHSAFEMKKINIYNIEAYKYYTPDIEKCEVELNFELQRNKAFNYGYESLNDIKDGNIEKYLQEKE